MQTVERITGKDLLRQVSALTKEEGINKREVARRLGYVNGDRVLLTEFYNALLEARGIVLESPKEDGRGREATYRLAVHKNGNIVIGAAYTEAMGLKAGEEFDIKLGYKHIKLVKVEEEQ